VTPSAPYDEVLRRAVDGTGGVVEAVDDSTGRALLAHAASSGFDVIDARATGTALDRLSFGPLVELVCDPVVHVDPRTASTRLLDRLRSSAVQALRDRSLGHPLFVAVPRPRPSDDVMAGLEAVIDETASLPVVWMLDHTSPRAQVIASGDSRNAEGAESTAPEPGADEDLVSRIVAACPLALLEDEIAALTGTTAEAISALVGRSPRLERVGASRAVVRSSLGGHQRPFPAAVERAVLREALALLVRRGVPFVLLAEQALRAASPGDDLVIQILVDACRMLDTDHPDAAADYGISAASLMSDPGESLTSLAWMLLPILWRTSRTDEARRVAGRVFSEDGRGDVEARVLWWLARLEGSAERAVRYTSDALAVPGTSEATQVRVLGIHLRLLSTLGEREQVDSLLPAAIARAHDCGDLESESRLISCDSIRRFYRGEYVESRTLAKAAARLWKASGAPLGDWMPEMIWAPHVELQLGDPLRALERLDAMIAENGETNPSARRFLHAERSLALLALGRLAEGWDEAVLATTVSERFWSLPPGASDRLQAIALSVRLKIALHRGDAAALHELDDLITMDTRPGTETHDRLAWWRLLLDEARTGESPESVDVDSLRLVSWLDPTDDILIARALIRQGMPGSIARLAARATASVELSRGHPFARAVSMHLEGLAEGDADMLRDVSSIWKRRGRPLLSILARTDLGLLLSAEGDPRGLAMLEKAHADLSAIGAHRDAWHVRRALRDRGRPVVARRGRDALDVLTPTESRVVARAVMGLTAPKIAQELAISPHTVTTHIRHIYAKLGVSSRRELIDRLGADGQARG
jgi:DNA-binding CsgD family transcriptional regulator